MKQILISFLLCLILASCSRKPSAPPELASAPVRARSDSGSVSNVVVTIHQGTINDLLAAIGPLQGKGSLLPKSNAFGYEWSLTDPRVEIYTDSVAFMGLLEFHILGSNYRSNARGRGEVLYDSLEQRLYLQIGEIAIEREPKFLGMKIPVNKINLSSYAGKGIGILSHLPLEASFLVKKPQEEKKAIHFEIVNHQITYMKEQVEVKLHFRFHGEPSATKPNSGSSK